MRNFIIAIAATVFFNVPGVAQETKQELTYKTGNPADWPAELDAVSAAPNNHEILLENDKVRVLSVTPAPNEVEKVHHHQWPSVLYVMQAEDFTDRDAEGNLIMDTRTLDEPLQFPLTMWKDPEAPHSATNLSNTTPIKLIRVELKNSASNENLAIINGLYESFSKGDVPGVLGRMDSNIVWNEAEGNSLAAGNPYTGPDAVLAGVFAPIMEMYQSFGLKDIELHEMSNDKVLATLYYDITTKKGNKYQIQAAHFWTLQDGKIIKFQQYADTKKLAESEQ